MWRRIANPGFLLLIAFLLISHSFSIAQDVSQGERKVLSKVVPIYPQLARKANLSGVVKLDAVVAPDGKVQFTQLVGGNPIFVQAAEDAVRKWRFEPASKQTVERIELRFNR